MGVMLIHVFCGEWPFPTDVFQPDPQNPDSMVPVTEVERRAEFLRKVGNDHPLTPLMRRCLSNNSTLRPDAAELYTQLCEVKGHLPVVAETKIESVRQLQSSQDETVAVRKSLEERDRELKSEKLENERLLRENEALRVQLQNVSLRNFAESAVSTLENAIEVNCNIIRLGREHCHSSEKIQ